MKEGVLAGYPMTNLKATLVDGSYHAVDSSEMAFKTAAALAYREGLPKANPVILEPVGNVKVVAPNAYTGDLVGDLNKRRGRILSMTPMDQNDTEIEAVVPAAEMKKYATDLKALTNGRGSFVYEITNYEEAPQTVAEVVIAEAKNNR